MAEMMAKELVAKTSEQMVSCSAALMVALMVSGKADLMDEKVVVAKAVKLEL